MGKSRGKWKWESLSRVRLPVIPRGSPGQSTGVGNPPLLQGIFPVQGSNPGLPLCRRILYQLSYTGSPKLLQWIAYPFSGRSSEPRNQTGVSCIAGEFFTNWAMRRRKSKESFFRPGTSWDYQMYTWKAGSLVPQPPSLQTSVENLQRFLANCVHDCED